MGGMDVRITGLSAGYEGGKRGAWRRGKDGVEDNPLILRELDLSFVDGELVSLLGPSGSGKTTLLGCLAGVIEPVAGRIAIGGRVVVSVEERIWVRPEARRIGFVFQNDALWPHMTVFANLAYPLRVRRVPRNEIPDRVIEVARLMHVERYLTRLPHQLSGGERRRVALGRGIIYRPDLLILDEPLSNLDASLRDELGEEIRSLQRRLAIPTLHVTHDQHEARSISDRIAVLHNGRIAQIGRPEELLHNPAGRFVSEFITPP